MTFCLQPLNLHVTFMLMALLPPGSLAVMWTFVLGQTQLRSQSITLRVLSIAGSGL